MRILYTFTLFLFLTACGGNKAAQNLENTTDKTAENIIGKYEWVSSKFMTRGMEEPKISNPKTRNYTVIIDIQTDKIAIEKNGKNVASVPYKIIETTNNQQLIQVQIPQDDFPFFIASGPLVFDGDEMKILGTYNDAGEDQTYKRIK